jgi:hypothetical protein
LNDTVQFSPLNIARRLLAQCSFIACLIALLVLSGAVHAAAIDASLNVFYADPADPSGGGTWTLSAKADDSGLLSLNVFLQGIEGTTVNDVALLAPRGTVNGAESAGFFPVVGASGIPGVVNIGVLQAPTRDGIGHETVFYGVGSIVNAQGGAPNYPGQPAGTVSIGPSIPSLTNVQNGVWGNGDALGDAEWDHAAVLLSGTFLPGSTPGFYTGPGPEPSGLVFLTTGTSTIAGAHSDDDETTVTTLVRSNLEFRGDYNGDGVVDARDYTVWRNTMGQVVPPLTGADGNGDGTVNVLDYTVWKNNYGQTAPGPGSLVGPISTVPEPNTALLATILVGLAPAALRCWRGNSAGRARNSENFVNPGETA